MAKTICPVCGAMHHVNTGDPAAFEERYPELLIIGIAVRVCAYCCLPVSEGTRVEFVGQIARRPTEIPLGAHGTVFNAVTTAAAHSVYRVDFDSGRRLICLRGELRPLESDGG